MMNNPLVLTEEQIDTVSGGNISQAAFEGGLEGAATGAGIGAALAAYAGPFSALLGGLSELVSVLLLEQPMQYQITMKRWMSK
jgi:hypothetical protein